MVDSYGAKPKILINGAELAENWDGLREELIVDDHLHMPDFLSIRFRDPDRTFMKESGFQIGGEVRVMASKPGEEAKEPLITAEVIAFQGEYGEGGNFIEVMAYDYSYRLQRGKRTESYQDQYDSDIAKDLASKAGLEIGNIELSATKHEHISQVDQSDWEFLRERARANGFEIRVRGKALDFCKPSDASSAAPSTGDLTAPTGPLELVFGKEFEYRPRLSAAEQVKDVEVRSWDPLLKEELKGWALAGTKSFWMDEGPSPSELAEKVGNPTFVSVNHPFSEQAEIDAYAEALKEHIGGNAYYATGKTPGEPKLVAGASISVSQTGGFDARCLVTSSRHCFNTKGYETHFQVSGREPLSWTTLTSGKNGSSNGSRIDGVVPAIVTQVQDPESMARVKVKFPWLGGNYESNWARLVQPAAGKGYGFIHVPEIDDEVLVAFEQGDFQHPYVLGGLYNGIDRPEMESDLFDGSQIKTKGFISREGSALKFIDSGNEEGIALHTKDQAAEIVLSKRENAIKIRCQGGRIELQGTDISIKATGSLKLSAGGAVSIQGKPIELN